MTGPMTTIVEIEHVHRRVRLSCGHMFKMLHVGNLRCNVGDQWPCALCHSQPAALGSTEEPPDTSHVYVGGYEIDPRNPTTCQICGKHPDQHAAPAPSDRPTWQPIETAPKDGSRVLIAWADGMVTAGYYGKHFSSGEQGWFTANGFYISPTHWQPLPPAPQPEDAR